MQEASQAIDKQYNYWRTRILYALIIGYASFYLVRQNFSLAVPSILDEFGLTKTQIGWILTAFSISYGICKFIAGCICDRSNARYFMAIGLIGAALVNIGIGFSSSIWMIGVFYVANAWFQSMGWPPCTRSLTQWFGPKELGTKWGICNSSREIGAIGILIAAPWLIQHFEWRMAFIAPGIACIVLGLIIFERLRDNPKSLGLPSIEEKEQLPESERTDENERISYREIFFEHILPNKPLWHMCIANFFIYVIRMGFFNWAPTFLKETKGISLAHAGFQMSSFEFMGLIGGILAGWFSDKIFSGRRSAVSCLYMGVLALCLLFFWMSPGTIPGLEFILLSLMGFLLYGPQVLVGVAAAEFGSRKAAASAAGLTGVFGYLGGAFSGVGVGFLADTWGWNAPILFFLGSAALGTLLFLINWNKTQANSKLELSEDLATQKA
ncbi:MAG TPA: MFS transporter [Opitutae bacterium]|mgnify:CR=1 FL=1|nr:MFS transporter [Opitutae bacterium]|tara:strand:+ start:333 stop:1649 length:1317 start_codon:yes stop_codon:yes gene_type:complete